MIGLLLVAALPGLCIAWVCGFLVRRLSPRWGLVDRPGHRKVHATPTPLGGGIAIWLGLVAPFALGHLALEWIEADGSGGHVLAGRWTVPQSIGEHIGGLRDRAPRLWFLLSAATVLMLLGLWDDRKGLHWRLRLAVQTAVALAVVCYWPGWRLTFYLLDHPWITGAISVVWIVGLINSFNMLDNMDGLSGGVAAIGAVMLAAVLWLAPDPQSREPQLFVSGFLLVLTGAVLGFLWHNRPPARLFMGDAGSYLIGFCLATATAMATFTGGDLPPHTILAPLCVLAVPLYDTVTVIWIRLREGRSPFEGDKNHFSHRLVELGMSKSQAVLTIYLTTATCGLCALLLMQVNAFGAVVIALVVCCVLTLIGILETVGRRRLRD